MAILSFCGKRYTVDHAVKGADYIHGYDAAGLMVVSFEGVADFSKFAYDGEYMLPEMCEAEGCNETILANGTLRTKDGRKVDAWNVGALGFKGILTSADDLDAAKDDGIYVYQSASIPKNAPFDKAAVVFVFGSDRADSQKVQFGFRYGGAGQGKFRALYSNEWQVWSEFAGLIEDPEHPGCYYRYVNETKEYVNPPLVVGKEYRTTERFNGLAVYTKLIDCGKMPNKSSAEIEHNLGATRIVRSMCYLNNVAFSDYRTDGDAIKIVCNVNITVIYLDCANELSERGTKVQAWYTKE